MAVQGATFKKNGGAYAPAVMNGKTLDIKDDARRVVYNILIFKHYRHRNI
jgi:hypothetical protein